MTRMLVVLFAAAMIFGCRSQQDQGAKQGQEPQEPTAGAAQGEQPPGQQPGQQPSGQQQMATGTLTDVKDNQITVRTAAGEQMEMKLSDSAQITMNGQPMQRDRLQEGANVRASYSDEGGEKTVQKLEIQSMGAGGMQPGGEPASPEQPGGAAQQPPPQR